MKYKLKHYSLLAVGWISIGLGIIGMLLPVMPTVPFMILAAACFSRTSPRFHAMLMDNRWVGKPLQQWDQTKSISRRNKVRAILMICITFTGSILLFWGQAVWQSLLILLASILIGVLLRLKESQSKYEP